MNWEIELTPETLAAVTKHIPERYDAKRAANIPDQKIGPQDGKLMEFWGTRNEAVYGQFFGLPLNHRKSLTGDGGCWDYRHFGAYVSVKGRFPGDHLRYFLMKKNEFNRCFAYKDGDPDQRHPPDLIVCVEPLTETMIRFRGWCTFDEFRKKCEFKDWHQPSFGIHQEHLHDMDEYIELLKEISAAYT